MNLTYNILWFDDTDEVFTSLNFKPLDDIFADLGFKPNYKLVTTPDDFTKQEPYKKYDLIVVDYNLEEYDKHGQEFIEKVREHQIYTEIIFYSNKPVTELWQAIFDNQLEGVFVTNRDGILDKIINVSKQIVKKVLDIENMRGIVMAEVGDIDIILDSIIENGINSLGGETQTVVFKKFYTRANQQVDRHKENLDNFKDNPTIEGLIEHCDSYKRWVTIKSICKRHDTLKDIIVGDYNEEILKPRNYLAHGKYETIDGGGYIFEYQGEKYKFTDEIGEKLRKKITEYKELFITMNDKL